MIGILGGMGTQAGLDFCNKIAVLNRGKKDQQYPKFILFNKSDTPKRPENLKRYFNVLDELVKGCRLLQKNKCKFIVMPCNTAHYWYNDLQRKVKIPIISMPREVFLHKKKGCKKNSDVRIVIERKEAIEYAFNNIKSNKEFVVNIVSYDAINYMNQTCAPLKAGESELEYANLDYSTLDRF